MPTAKSPRDEQTLSSVTASSKRFSCLILYSSQSTRWKSSQLTSTVYTVKIVNKTLNINTVNNIGGLHSENRQLKNKISTSTFHLFTSFRKHLRQVLRTCSRIACLLSNNTILIYFYFLSKLSLLWGSGGGGGGGLYFVWGLLLFSSHSKERPHATPAAPRLPKFLDTKSSALATLLHHFFSSSFFFFFFFETDRVNYACSSHIFS